MRVNVERDLAARRRHFRKCRYADCHLITDAVRFHDRLIRMLHEQRSSEMCDHRRYCTAQEARGGAPSTGSAGSSPSHPPLPQRSKPSFPPAFHKNLVTSTAYTQHRPSFSLQESCLLLQSACSQKREYVSEALPT